MKRTERFLALLLALALALTLTALPGYALAVETGETAEETVSEEVVSEEVVAEETAETETADEEAVAEEPAETETAAEAVAVEEAAAEETTADEVETVTEESTTAASTTLGSGKCGSNVTWTLTSDGTLTISGSGAMYGYSEFDAPWWEVDDDDFYAYGDVTKIVVKSGVTTIGKYAFAHLHGVTSTSIPSTLTSIGKGAFYDTPAFKTLTIPSSVTTIGDSAFSCIDGLTKVTIPSSVTSIGSYAFYGCYNLTSVTIPATVTYIGTMAFGYTYEGYFDDPGDDYLMSSFVIYGYTGSAAETYAKNNGIRFVSLGSVLATPTLKSITNVTNGVKITWGAVSGATSYYVYRKAAGSSSWTKLNTVTTTSYTSTGVSSGTTYTFTVRAVNSSGVSGYNATGLTIRYLSTPSVTLSNTTSGVKVAWTSVSGASGYYVYRRTENGSYTKIATVSTGTLSYTDKAASAGVR
ncbi:MAG: fibronectin type III domain-containing protein, partial [Clostridiales bacterium]|nr:fibronectin type III domain-containing protein [Clostridiales bacterium]